MNLQELAWGFLVQDKLLRICCYGLLGTLPLAGPNWGATPN